MKDYYKILGISKKATPSVIKKAYYGLARKHHPDKGGNEEKFKEINEAYQVLSNKKKRNQYDNFGRTFDGMNQGGSNTQWNWGGGFDMNSQGFDLGDILGEIFGGRGDSPFSQKKDFRKGKDLEFRVDLSLEDVLEDKEKEVVLEKMITCPRCNGVGGEPGTKVKECFSCRGMGRVQRVRKTILGAFTETAVCPECEGEGYKPEKPCNVCKGKGRIKGKERIKIVLPAGVDTNQVIKIKGRGNAGIKGGKNGDLYVVFFVRKHPIFQRRGDDLYFSKEIVFSQAVLGDEIEIKILGGDKILLEVPKGTESGKVLRVSQKGIPHFGSRGKGDLFVKFLIKTPQKLNRKQKELLEKLKGEGL